MIKIDNLSNSSKQLVKIIMDDGSLLTLNFSYLATIQRWIMDVSHETLTVNGINLCIHPNILFPWKNTAGFGIAITSTDRFDPFDINDFSSGRVAVYVLSKDDVSEIGSILFGN